jgi:hypothetical protein
VDVEIVHHEMDAAHSAVPQNDLLERPDERRCLSIRRGEGESLTRERLDDAEDVGRPASHALVRAVDSSFVTSLRPANESLSFRKPRRKAWGFAVLHDLCGRVKDQDRNRLH